jgi:prephenate dehydrogenase
MSVLMAGHLTTVPEADLVLAGPGLRDVTRVAASDPALWEQIVGANSAAVLSELREVQDELDVLVKAVEAMPAAEELRSQLQRGVTGTQKIAGKHGSPAVPYSQVVVVIPDEPGALARLFAEVEAAGVNVEDVAIEHDPAREVGYLSLSVAPEASEALAASMAAHGWSVS